MCRPALRAPGQATLFLLQQWKPGSRVCPEKSRSGRDSPAYAVEAIFHFHSHIMRTGNLFEGEMSKRPQRAK